MFPFKLLSSLFKSRRIIKKIKPDIVIGTGGFASGPLLKVANDADVPTLLQEQNSYPGITNKWLAKKANKICVAYDGLDRFFPADKIIKTGNPVRQDLIEIDSKREEGFDKFNLNRNKKILLVIGGSLGARRINQLIENELDFIAGLGIQIIWQCGKLYFEEYKKYNSENVQVLQFIDRMDLAYASTDFIISRAGAGSVSELCIVGKPVLFIPSPNVAEDHQTKNARAIVDQQGALMLKETELGQKFEDTFKALVDSEELQHKLSDNIRKMALPKATSDIVDEIEKILKI